MSILPLIKVWCCYNMINVLRNPQKRHPIACPLGGMGVYFVGPKILPVTAVMNAKYNFILDYGRFQFNFRKVIFKLNLGNSGWGISYEIALRWMPQDLTDDKSTLVQVMAWCRQATSHYLSQFWPRFLSPNGVTRPQWVNNTRLCMFSKNSGNIISLHVIVLDRWYFCPQFVIQNWLS